jgi:hypothetical protein
MVMIQGWLKRIHFNDYAYLLVFLFYIPLVFRGFGTDSDTYTALNAWNHFLATGDYVPSRLPGYVIHEIGIYYATWLGDNILSNLLTLMFAVILCFFLIKIAKFYSIPTVSILLVLLNPVFIVNSTSTVDYIWSLAFFVIGFYFISRERILLASLAFGFSSAIRLSNGLLVLIIYLIFFILEFRKKKKIISAFLLGGLLILVINFFAYYLPLDFTHWKLSVFLAPSLGDETMWSPLMRIGRWGYKNLLFWGIPSILLIIILLLMRGKKFITEWSSGYKRILSISIVLIALVEILFLKYPIEIEYLLPLLPFAALIFGILYKEKPRIIIVLSCVILLNGFFSISIARPNIPNHATAAQFEFTSVQGYLLSDISTRPAFEANYYKTKNWWYAQRLDRQNNSEN